MKVSKLKDCCTIIAGQSPESKYYNSNGDGLPFFQGKADFGELYPSIRVYCSQPTKIAEKDDILLSVRAPVGPTNLAPCKVCIGRGLTALRPSEVLLTRYVLLFFRYFEAQLASKGTGTTFKAITQDVVKNLEIPIPPLPEQERIITRIDELFSQLDAGVETLKKTKAQLAVYRQAVLKEAFEDCLDSVTMGSVATMIDPQPSHRTPPEFENGIPYIGIGDIDYTGKTIRFKDARKVNPAVYEEHLQRYTLREGDFLMGKIGTIGKPFRLPLPQNYTLSANVILIQPDAEKINPEYLFWQFSSPLITEQLMEGKNETSQPAFGIQKARLLQIKMCSAEAQDRIVCDIREKISVCENIEQTVTLALQQAEAMRQCILKDAFEGKM